MTQAPPEVASRRRRRPLSSCCERLLILHLRLESWSTGCGHELATDEGASDAELLEPVLFFSSSSSSSSSSCTNGDGVAQQQEAIQFAGLCSALFTLPETIRSSAACSSSEGIDRAQVVHLQNSSLIFCPLEGDGREIVAVAQVPSDATPRAVHSAIHRSHQLFRLLRGGGIHARLLGEKTFSDEEHPIGSEIVYPGMKQLYRLRKRERTIVKASATVDQDDELDRIRKEIKDLYINLPIWSLREDLRIHWSAFLENASTFRNLVDSVPPPIPVLREHALITSVVLQSPYITTRLGLMIKALLATAMDKDSRDHSSNESQQQLHPTLLGVSVFARGLLLLPTMTADAELSVTNETAALLLWYMTYHCQFQALRQQQQHTPRRETRSRSVSPSPRQEHHSVMGPLPTLKSLIGTDHDLMDDPPQPPPLDMLTNATDGRHQKKQANVVLGHFQTPPPLSFLSSLDEPNSFDYGEGHLEKYKVWAPPVHLPLYPLNPGNQKVAIIRQDEEMVRTIPSFVRARICLYHLGEFSFLMYISNLQASSNSNNMERNGIDSLIYRSLFHRIDAHLTTQLKEIAPRDVERKDDAEASHHSKTDESSALDSKPGRDIIFLDRQFQYLVLISDLLDDVERKAGNTKEQQQQTKGRGLFFLSRNGQHAPDTSPARRTEQSISSNARISSLEPNCRYQLAAQLSLDSLLALEDAMDEVRLRTTSEQCSGETPFQMCTLLAKRWVYTYKEGGKELYVLFDSAFFVTVADVQNEAQRIREEFFC